MVHKILAGMLTLSFISVSFAETCPSVTDIKKHSTRGWTAYDSETEIALSVSQLNHFRHQAAKFVLAEWSKKNDTIHCYYSNASGSEIQAYFAKNSLTPEKTRNRWYLVSGHMDCAAGKDECLFRLNPLKQRKFT